MRAARRIFPVFALVVVPVYAYALTFWVAWPSSFALDFRQEIYPEAREILAGENPYPDVAADLAQGPPSHIWPPLVEYLASPFLLLSVSAASIAVVLLGLACVGAALYVVGVRDWRVYGAASLWGPVIGDMRTAHLSLILCLLVALVWRARSEVIVGGLALGLAIGLKLFLWPLVIWLASIRRWREAAIAALVAAASLLLLLPFTGILECVRVLRRLASVFDQVAYTPYGLLVQAGAEDGFARVTATVIGLGVLALAWQRRSFTLCIVAALLLSPIVWVDYFALLAIPLAITQPRLSWAWLLPILTLGIPPSAVGAGATSQTLRVLVIFATVAWYAERRERRSTSDRSPSRDVAALNEHWA